MGTNIRLLLLVLSIALAGPSCASGWRRPAGTEGIDLRWSDSAQIEVGYAWLEQQGDEIVVRGHVSRRFEGTDTTRSYLRIAEIGANGQRLRVARVEFEPKRLSRRSKPPHPVGYFRYPLSSPVHLVQELRIEAVEAD